jgi:TPR repeat protein
MPSQADSGSVDGMYELGWCHKEGTGVAKSLEAARRIFQRAETKGHLPSRFEMWVCLNELDVSGAARLSAGSTTSGSTFILSGAVADPGFVAFFAACKQHGRIDPHRLNLFAKYYMQTLPSIHTSKDAGSGLTGFAHVASGGR